MYEQTISEPKTFAIVTLGCKVNQYESEAISEMFMSNGYTRKQFDEIADVYIVNTCTVTNVGDKKSRQLLRRAKTMNPNAFVVACGCYAQVSPDEVSKVEGINLIIGTKDRSKIYNIVNENISSDKYFYEVSENQSSFEYEDLSVNNSTGKTRAYIKIQDGCKQFCSYCIIPYARGPVRSRGLDKIYYEIKSLADKNFKEIVLAGIHVASYGKDLVNTDLLDVIELAASVNGIERIRLSSIDPVFMTQENVSRLAKTDKLCNHFHLSLQSGCDKTLERMNRKYNSHDYKETIRIIQKYFPEAALWTDVIAGFPGETDEDFSDSYEFIKSSGLCKLHVFPYSPKKGTPAAVLPNQVDNKTKESRAHALKCLSDILYTNYLYSTLNTTASVLFEKQTESGCYEGHTKNYVKVLAVSNKNIINTVQAVKPARIEKDYILGEIIFA